MRWIEATVPCTGDPDELCLRLEALGVGGMVVEDEEDFRTFLEQNRPYWDYVDEELERRFAGVSRVKFYLADDEEGHTLLEKIRAAGFAPAVGCIEDSDWENNWRQFYRPIPVGERLLVVPAWEDVPAEPRIPLRLDPGLIFGTGSHATTRLCLAALEGLAAPGYRALDLGCGSGILAIGALVLGCAEAVGCDIDDKAPSVAQANAALNGIGGTRFRVLAGDVLADRGLRTALGSGFDIVLANIVADVIIALAAFAGDFMAPGAAFVCSGILEGRQGEVERALRENGFTVETHTCEEDWHCYVCRQIFP